MSKYVKKKHGLTIGSDNWFFVIDRVVYPDEPELVLPEGVGDFRDGYRAIVAVDGYTFDVNTTLTVFIKTPAEQLIFVDKEILVDKSFTSLHDKKTIEYKEPFRYRVINPWIEKWLNDNIGPKYQAWDTYTRNRTIDGSLFFKKRNDAVKFCKMIEQKLAGMKFGY